MLQSGCLGEKNGSRKEELSCGCLYSLKHLNFCSQVSISQHVITKYLQHAKHSCATVNRREREKNLSYLNSLKKEIGG